MKRKLFWILIVLLILFSVIILTNKKSKKQPIKIMKQGELIGIQKSESPWIPEISHLRERLDSIGLPALSEEGTALHIHQHLDIFIHGKNTPIPTGIGINEEERFISQIHTHDMSGIIHVESPKVQDFNLGQFFDIWGLNFTQTCIGSYCSDNTNNLYVYINGHKFIGDPRTIILQAHQEIVITFGTNKETPKTITSSFAFDPGE